MKTITQHTKTYGMHQKQYNRRFHNDKCLHLKKKKISHNLTLHLKELGKKKELGQNQQKEENSRI